MTVAAQSASEGSGRMNSLAMQPLYVVVVEFRVHPERAQDFERLMLENAETSRDGEPSCRQFDVCKWPDDPGRFFLYELYEDRAAFQAHLDSAHFQAFDAEVKPWVIAKTVETLMRLAP